MKSDPQNDRAETTSAIDYLSKDFGSFRRLMLDRLARVAPDAATGHPADFATTLVELLAYAAEQASYYQDAVATEAYLGTARLRTSVRRHARLLDYPIHDGCNARAFVAIVVAQDGAADLSVLPAGTPLCTRVLGQLAIVSPEDLVTLRAAGGQIFETMHDLLLRAAHNQMQLSATNGILPAGATEAMLVNEGNALALRAGDVLIFEEISTGIGTSSDPQRRHAVRLTSATVGSDAADGVARLKITWSAADALPFELTLSRTRVVGNVVLADQGYTLPDSQRLPMSSEAGAAGLGANLGRPLLHEGPLTFRTMLLAAGQAQSFLPDAPASAAFPKALEPGTVIEPCITLKDAAGRTWNCRPDLLDSGPYARDFVIETEDDGRTYLRFGDDSYGKRPLGDLYARYRVGNGTTGNVGAEAIYHIASGLPGILYARNPLPARGAINPESIETVRLQAPQRFRQQDRAVTLEDYERVVRRFAEVQDVLVSRRFIGSYFVIECRVLRQGGLPVDAEFVARLSAYLDAFRMAGHVMCIVGPTPIPLEIEVVIGVTSGALASTVLADVKAALGTSKVGARTGLLHPDRLTLGQRFFASQFITAAMSIPGVKNAEVTRFMRKDRPDEVNPQLIELRPSEVASLDASLSLDRLGTLAPVKGTFKVVIRGSR